MGVERFRRRPSFATIAACAALPLSGCKPAPRPIVVEVPHDTSDAMPLVPLYDSPHYTAASTASPRLTREILSRLEIQRRAYLRELSLRHPDTASRLHLRLHRSRREMREMENLPSWAEGMYDDSVCIEYVDPTQNNPWHWSLHEAVHQLNHEVAHLTLPGWANEGVACLFSTSRSHGDSLSLGELDPQTYPIWHYASLHLSGDPEADARAGEIVLAADAIAGRDTSDLSHTVNAHYITWTSLVHYLWATNREAWWDWVRHDPTVPGLERRYGSLDTIQARWYRHLQALVSSQRASAVPISLRDRRAR